MKLYEYYGSISSMASYRHTATDITLEELYNNEKPPIRLSVYGALAEYIYDIEMTDAEERYLNANWYYDRNLCLRYIEIPSADPATPAKIIAQDGFLNDQLAVFGLEEYIETDKPAPMSKEAYHKWLQWKSKYQ